MFCGQSPFKRGPAWLGRRALLGRAGGFCNIVMYLAPGILQVAVLIPGTLASNDELPFAVQSLGNQMLQPSAAGRVDPAYEVKVHPELNFRGHFIDILASGAGGTNRLHLHGLGGNENPAFDKNRIRHKWLLMVHGATADITNDPEKALVPPLDREVLRQKFALKPASLEGDMSSISVVGKSELDHVIARVALPATTRLPDRAPGDRTPQTPEKSRRQGKGSNGLPQKRSDEQEHEASPEETPRLEASPIEATQLYSPSQKTGVACSQDQTQHNVDLRA